MAADSCPRQRIDLGGQARGGSDALDGRAGSIPVAGDRIAAGSREHSERLPNSPVVVWERGLSGVPRWSHSASLAPGVSRGPELSWWWPR